MKTHVILLSCVCTALSITVPYEEGSFDNPKEYKTELKDIRLVPIKQIDKPFGNKEANDLGGYKPSTESKIRRQNLSKFRGEKRKHASSISRVGNGQDADNDPNHRSYMQKMANQLYMAQRHASLLSDYQKFIINQDPDVKRFVLAQSIQERNPKPFSRQRQNGGRALATVTKAKYVSPETVTPAVADSRKIVVMTPKAQTVRKTSQPPNDPSAQAAHVQYVTLPPQSLTHLVGSAEPSPKVTLVPYHTPQYTYLGVTHTPSVETVHVPTASPLRVVPYVVTEFNHEESGHEDASHHGDTKYEFMYNVKDHEKQNHFGHKESRTDKTTYGFYFVHLPDGRLETVKYWADKTGYHAKVDYQGEAKHPIHNEHKVHSHNLIHH